MHFPEINKNADVSIFLTKKENIFLHRFLLNLPWHSKSCWDEALLDDLNNSCERQFLLDSSGSCLGHPQCIALQNRAHRSPILQGINFKIEVNFLFRCVFTGKYFKGERGGRWGRGGSRKRRSFDRPQTKKESEGNEDERKATHTRFDDEPTAKKVKTEDDSWYDTPHVYIMACDFSW